MQPAAKTTPHQFHPTILREYDIRGIVGETLHEADAFQIGQAFATMARTQTQQPVPVIALGRDGRLSSPAMASAVARGMQAAGAEVIDIGVGPTPMLYFAVHHLNAHAGIMVTGSHNPPTHNGFKLMMGHSSFFGQSIRDLGALVESGALDEGTGSLRQADILVDYVQTLLNRSDIPVTRKLTLAWDPGNGAAGEVAAQLATALNAQGHRNIAFNTEIDGRFPNHHPDPSVPENLRQLQQTVAAEHCHLGLAFDGDGDRLGAVDDKGRPISPDHLLMLLAQAVLARTPQATIIADVKTSESFFEEVSKAGGTPLLWKTGHSHIKTKMKEIGAAFAGEASGHLFFADRYYGFDDGLYAALRLIEITATLDQPLSDVIDALPQRHSTPEIRINCDDSRKFTVIREIQESLRAQNIPFNDIDGIRATTPHGWWLLRASNTQAAIIARCESGSAEGLATLTDTLESTLAPFGLKVENSAH